MKTRKFVMHYWFVGWDCISLGAHVSLRDPNIEIHLPFGFIRVGWELETPRTFPAKQQYGW